MDEDEEEGSLLVSTDWLASRLEDPTIRIVDVRWYLPAAGLKGRDEYLHGHIPGAVFLDIDYDLAAPQAQGPGCLPLPSAEAFAEVAARAGIGPAIRVVAYDDTGGSTAARLWWLLRYYGHDRASLLDGGIIRWTREGRPLETQVPMVPRSVFVPRPAPDWVVGKDKVKTLKDDPKALLLDARAAERYEGTVRLDPIDARAGHIPGARSAPFTENLRSKDDARFLEPAVLRARYEALGAGSSEPIVSYCGCGVNACLNMFALYLVGFRNLLLYEGSWSDWSRDPTLPVAVGRDLDDSQ